MGHRARRAAWSATLTWAGGSDLGSIGSILYIRGSSLRGRGLFPFRLSPAQEVVPVRGFYAAATRRPRSASSRRRQDRGRGGQVEESRVSPAARPISSPAFFNRRAGTGGRRRST